MTTDHLTGKCKNCGCIKREHGPKGKCKTRLKDTTFEEWTDKDREECGFERLEQAVAKIRLPSAVEVNRALNYGARSVYGILPGDAPGGGKRRIFGYRKPRKSAFAEGKLGSGTWVQLVDVEIEPA